MNEPQLALLVGQLDVARLAGDTPRLLEIEAEIREFTGGKQRHITGVAHMTIPMPGVDTAGKVEDFDEWSSR